MPQIVAGWIATGLTNLGVTAVVNGVSLATALGSLAASALFSALSGLLGGGGSTEEQRAEIRIANSLPPKRWVYGRARMPATWLPPVVIDGVLYGCLILNSRPSAADAPVILVDQRPVDVSGDIFDFGAGATATTPPFASHAKFWLGRGDQTAPPAQIMAEAGDATATDTEKFWPSDAWAGRTVLWVRLVAGAASSRSERWPSTPPQIDVETTWSKVWDPRNPDQDPEDADTWVWSENQALCLLDALRTNPVRRRKTSQLRIEDFIEAANVADQAVPVAAGGTEPRYRVGGFIVWNGRDELLDQMRPLILAGGGTLRQVGGKLGYLAGRFYPASMTITDAIEDAPIVYRGRQASRDVPSAVRAVFPDPEQEWEDGDLFPIAVSSRDWDGSDDGIADLRFSLVPYPRQAQRLAQIVARQAAQEARLSMALPPSAIDLLIGARVDVTLPGDDVRNGLWMLESINPNAWMQGDGSVVFRCDVTLRRDDPDVWSWSPADEQDRYSAPVPPLDLSLSPPADLSADLTESGVLTFAFSTVPSAAFYEWQVQPVGSDIWTPLPDLSADLETDGTITATLPLAADTDFHVRVRTRVGAQASAWAQITATAPEIPIDPETPE